MSLNDTLQIKKRVALYIRVSTDEQAKEGKYGIEVQEDRLKKFCESQEYELKDEHVYKDEGYSGSLLIEKRPALKRLFEDAKAKKFDIVVVYRLDRFFRSSNKLLNALEVLIAMGIDFKSSTETFNTDTPNGRFVLQMLGNLAELEREVIRERMSGGREQAARANKWVTGVPPYGYKVDKKTKQLEIIPDEAEVVRKFYHWLVYERCSLSEITRRANELQMPAPKHNTQKKRKTFNYWWKRSINRVLVNEVYTGDFYYRKYKRPFKYLDAVLDKEHQRPEEDWISIKVPQIISKDLFQSSIKQLRKNQQDSKRNTKRPYMYSSLLYCGYTGNKLQSGYQTPKVGKESATLGKYYHTYVRERE
ncbi:MAG: recombinase family protein [Candidatus Paceibacterota bacterium]